MRLKDTLGLSYLVKLVEHKIRNEIDSSLSSLGLTAAQYSTLSALESEEKLTNAELARRCAVTPQTMNKIMQNLEADGFVRKSNSKEHGLKINFEMTAKAHKVVCKAHASVNEIEKNTIKGINKAQYQEFEEFLKKCLENLN